MRFKGPLLIPFLNIFVLTLRGTYSDIYQVFVWNNSAFTSMRNAAKTRSALQQYLPYYIKSMRVKMELICALCKLFWSRGLSKNIG